MRKLITLSLVILISCMAFGQAWSGILDPSRATDWTTVPGFSIPTGRTQCGSTISAYTGTAAAINSAIAACSANTFVLLGTGTFTLSTALTLSKNNVTLRGSGPSTVLFFTVTGNPCGGNGADVCIGNPGFYYGSTAVQVGGTNSCSWTGGYSQGATVLTIGSCGGASLVNGQQIIIDQLNDQTNSGTSDTGSVYNCDYDGPNYNGTNFLCHQSGETASTYGRPHGSATTPIRAQNQAVTIVSGCATSCNSTGPYAITISPGLVANNWRTGQTPGIWWAGTYATGIGIENMRIDHAGSGGVQNFGQNFYNCYQCWATGVTSSNSPGQAHFFVFESQQIIIQSNYVYATFNSGTTAYGELCGLSSQVLYENNIAQQVPTPFIFAGCQDNVVGYNYSIDNVTTGFMSPSDPNHDAGNGFNLAEGNKDNGFLADSIHGFGSTWTYFRNWLKGFDTGVTSNEFPIILESGARGYNVIGNVLGTSGKQTNYTNQINGSGTSQNCSAPGSCTGYSACTAAIYTIGYGSNTCGTAVGTPANDDLVFSSLMRWGNYDIVTGAFQYNSSEVPTSSVGAYINGNSVPSCTPSCAANIPASFYLSSRPTYFNTPQGILAFPSNGPGVSGGTGPGGFASINPAENCYLNVMGGPGAGGGPILSFNATSCYTGTGQASAPTASPSSGAVPQTVTVTNTNTGTTVVCYNFTGSPATNGDGATCQVGSTPYTSSLSISVPETLYIIAGTSLLTDSSINSYTYTGTTPATPTFSPGAGTYTSAQFVTISTVTGGSIICYNTTGSPATNGLGTGCAPGSTLEGSSVTVSTSETLYAVAGCTGCTDSSVGTAAYVINLLSFAVLNPTSLSYGTVVVGIATASQTVVLSNTGGTTLNISSKAVTGDYAITGSTCGATLSSGFSCNIPITFTPTTTGSRTGTLTVTDDSGGVGGSTQTASLSGTGVTIVAGMKLTKNIKITSGIVLDVAGTTVTPSCGPPQYSCFNQSTSVVNLQNPIPSWGATTCNSTTIYTLATCGNLIGAGTARTPTDFNNTGIRVTDINTNGNPNTLWETADDPGVGLWNTDDSAFLGHVNSGAFFVFKFNGASATLISPAISFSGAVTFSNVSNNKVYSMGGSSTVLQQNVINFSTGGVTTTNLFDYGGTNCLTNTVNGYTGGVFPVTWNGQLSTDLTDNTFAMGFSTNGGQGTGQYMAVWQRGQVGCDLWRTDNGTITHNGAALGNLSNAQWGGANGGLADFSLIHDEATTLNPNYVNIGFTQNAFIQGTYSVGPYLWQVGTTNILHCGIGAPNWKASTAYAFGARVNPLTNNAGDYIYQIILNANVGTSGGSAPTWNQTPGGTQTDGTITWQNVGLGTASGAQYNCDGHGWKGATGVGVGKNVTYHTFANPAVPLLGTVPTAVTSITDTHLGATNGNISDTTWPLDISTDVGTFVNQLGTLPAALYNEMFLVSPPWQSPGVQNCVYNSVTCPGGTLQQLRRAHHTYNSGWEWSFDAVQGICVISQTGKYDLCATDGLGQFGNRSGAPSCNIGGPDWNASDSTDYSVGMVVYPQSVNGGNYIYKIQSCSGTCTTGSAHPTWVQSATVAGVGTFTDGTITWQAAPDINNSSNTAVQNCRSELMVWKLYH
jgi:ASPM-SPD-2-Hydin domain-containing protein